MTRSLTLTALEKAPFSAVVMLNMKSFSYSSKVIERFKLKMDIQTEEQTGQKQYIPGRCKYFNETLKTSNQVVFLKQLVNEDSRPENCLTDTFPTSSLYSLHIHVFQ